MFSDEQLKEKMLEEKDYDIKCIIQELLEYRKASHQFSGMLDKNSYPIMNHSIVFVDGGKKAEVYYDYDYMSWIIRFHSVVENLSNYSSFELEVCHD